MDIYNRISKEINSGTVFHSYIIEGKMENAVPLALHIAMGCNCLSVSQKPCTRCLPCRKIGKNNHPDVLMIRDNGSSIGIDMIRQLQKDIYIKPYEGTKKVFIIANGDRMTLQAQNCLLKVLEEPPGTGIIIITTPNHHELIPTIISRCQILKVEGSGNQDRYHPYLDLVSCFIDQNFIDASSKIEGVLKEQDNLFMEKFLNFLLVVLRDALVYKATEDRDMLRFKECEDIAAKIASGVRYEGIDRLINSVTKALEGTRYNTNPQLAMEFLLLEMQEVLLC